MIRPSALASLLVSLFALACAVPPGSGPTAEITPELLPVPAAAAVHVVGVLPPPLEEPPPMVPLESCLEEGGSLFEVASVDNDDVAEHGALLTFAIADDRRIAVASEDGTVKLWTLTGFVGELDPGAFLYGVEVDRAQVLDLAFFGEEIVAADVQGLVSMWSLAGTPRIVGGTDPDVGIVAVAVDSERGWVAHADSRAGGNVVVRGIDDRAHFGPLATELAEVRDLAFLPDGRLLLAGAGEQGIELRAADDPTRVDASYTPGVFTVVTEAAASRAGDTIAFVTTETLGVLDADLGERWFATGEHAPTSVAVSRTGRAVFSVGIDGTLRAWSGHDGTARDVVSVPEPVAVRIDEAGDLVVVGSRDGVLRAFECQR